MARAGHQRTGLDLAPTDLSVPFCSPQLTLQPQLPAASWVCPQKRRYSHFSCSLLVSFTLLTTPSPCCRTAACQRTARLLSGSFLLRALFGGCILHLLFFFCYSQGRKGGHKPKGRCQGKTDEPGRRGDATCPGKVLRGWQNRGEKGFALSCRLCPSLPLAAWSCKVAAALSCYTILLLHPSAPSHCSILLLHPAWPGHCTGHVCCGKWQVSPMAMTTSWGWRSRRRGTSGISLISLTLLLMQLTSLLLLLSSGLGPKIQSGGMRSTKQTPCYLWLFPESKPAGKLLPPAISYPLLWVFTPPGGFLAPLLPLQPPPLPWYQGLCSSQLWSGFPAAGFWKPSRLRQMKSPC